MRTRLHRKTLWGSQLRGILCAASLVLAMSSDPALFADSPNVRAPELELSVAPEIARAGHFQLSWSADDTLTGFILEEASDVSFTSAREVYRGADRAAVISGRSDGEYFFRVRSLDSAADIGGAASSAIVRVRVAHHSAAETFAYFSAGAMVFFATLLLMFRRGAGR